MKKLLIFGTLDHIPELRQDTNGNYFVCFSVMIGDNRKTTARSDSVEVSCTGKLAEIVMKSAYKGCAVFVEGFPAIHSFVNNNNDIISIQRVYAHSINILNNSKFV